jgi:hypothetical protein
MTLYVVTGGDSGGISHVIETVVAVNDKSATRIGEDGKFVGAVEICE